MQNYFLELQSELRLADGVGTDYYHNFPSYHPMADAFYVLGQLEFLNYSNESFVCAVRDEIKLACERMIDNGVKQNGTLGFGLGFEWRNLPPLTTYTVTTALAGIALTSAIKLFDFKFGRFLSKELLQIDRWFADLPTKDFHNYRFPMYGPKDFAPREVFNIAALAHAYNCSRGLTASIECKKLRFLIESQNKSGVWTYSSISNRVDLLHNCYIIEGLSWCNRNKKVHFENDVLRVFFQFARKGVIIDKGDFNDFQFQWHETPARAMSLGALIAVLGKNRIIICASNCNLHIHCKLIYKRLNEIRNSNIDIRSKAHLFFGLSRHFNRNNKQ